MSRQAPEPGSVEPNVSKLAPVSNRIRKKPTKTSSDIDTKKPIRLIGGSKKETWKQYDSNGNSERHITNDELHKIRKSKRQQKKEETHSKSKSKSKKNSKISRTNEEIPEEIQQKMLNMRFAILRSYTDDIADDMHASRSEHENFENEEANPKSPEQISPHVKTERLNKYTTQMRANNDVRVKGDCTSKIFVCIVAVSFDLAMRIPLLSLQFGGFYFLIAYLLCSICIAIPLSLVELALGQLTSQPASSLYPAMAPVLTGMGILVDIIRVINTVTTHISRSHAVSSLAAIFRFIYSARDTTCPTGSVFCYEGAVCGMYGKDDTDEHSRYGDIFPFVNIFWLHLCVQPNSEEYDENSDALMGRAMTTVEPELGIGRMQSMHIDHSVGAFIFMAFTAWASVQGVRAVHRFAVPIFAFFVLAWLAAMALVWFKCGSSCTLGLDFQSDFTALLDSDTWRVALFHSVAIMGVGDGTMHSIGMLLGFDNNIFFTSSIIFLYSNVLIILAFLMFMLFSEFSHNNLFVTSQLAPPMDWSGSGYLSIDVLNAFPSDSVISQVVISFLSIAIVLSSVPYHVLTFDMLTRRLLQIVSYLGDFNSQLMSRYIALVVFSFLYILHLYFGTLKSGERNILYEFIYAGILTVLFTEIFAIRFNFGFRRLFINVKTMLSQLKSFRYVKLVYWFLRIYYKYFLPTIIFACFLTLSDIRDVNLSTMTVMRAVVMVIAWMPAFVMIIVAWMKQANPAQLFNVESRWGPLNMVDRRRIYFDERAARIY